MPSEQEELARINRIVERARAGDPSVQGELYELLDEQGDAWRQLGDLAGHSLQAQLAVVAGNDLLAREAIQRTVCTLRDDLAGENSSPLERLLSQQVAWAWVRTEHARTLAAASEDRRLVEVRYYQQRVHLTQKDLLAAAATLATVRKLTMAAEKPSSRNLRVCG